MTSKSFLALFLLTFLLSPIFIWTARAQQQTYAEKLGYPKNARVLILHIDDAGMSWDSNEGTIQAIQKGVANSLSVMMPCPWVPAIVKFIKENPAVDAGLHLTLTAEWDHYRWGPLAGKTAVPGLVDSLGAMWPTVEAVAKHAKPDEVYTEIKAQLERARAAGFEPTHFDSHMGTLFATPEFMQRYVQLGIENKIPVMMPGGHNTMLVAESKLSPEIQQSLVQVGQLLWSSGLPVLDDLHNVSYNWKYPEGKNVPDPQLQKFATSKYIETIKQLKPGLTMVIMHCTAPSPVFEHISGSGKTRKGDMLAMIDPALKKFLQQEGIILTTWRDVMKRRVEIK